MQNRIPGLHQDTTIGSVSITDVWEPIEEGLVPLVYFYLPPVYIIIKFENLAKNLCQLLLTLQVRDDTACFNDCNFTVNQTTQPEFPWVTDFLIHACEGLIFFISILFCFQMDLAN